MKKYAYNSPFRGIEGTAQIHSFALLLITVSQGMLISGFEDNRKSKDKTTGLIGQELSLEPKQL